MAREQKSKASKLPLTFNTEAGQQADVDVPMAGQQAEVEIKHNIDIERPSVTNTPPMVFSPQLTAGQKPETSSQKPRTNLTAQDLLSKSEAELKELMPERTRETHNLLKSMKIMTAIMLGKDKNKELAQMLQTDKSFTSKQIKELEEQGLVKREGEGRETKYVVDPFNLMKFLQTKVIIKWGKKEERSNVQPKAALGGNQETQAKLVSLRPAKSADFARVPKTERGQSPLAVRWGKKEERTPEAGSSKPDVKRPASGA